MWNRQEKRSWDQRKASRNNRGIFGWIALTTASCILLGLNLFLLIVYPTVGTVHSIVGVVLGSIMVVGSTANLMGKFYEDG